METLFETKLAGEWEEINTVRELEGLRPEWFALWSRCPTATPFQSPEWVIPWWRHLGRGELWVLAWRPERRLRGLAPCFIEEAQKNGGRRVLFLGTGISDHLDLLVEPGFESAGTAGLLSHLASQGERWDTCDFQQLPGSSPVLGAEAPADLTNQVTVQEVCPVLNLSPAEEGLSGHVPSHMLQKLHYYRRRAQKNAASQMKAVHPDNFSELFETFLRLHQARWGSRGQNGVLADECLQAFHREAAEQMLHAGTLRLYALRLDGGLVASVYGFSHGGRTFYYLGGFKPEAAALSPGTLMIGHAIEAALQEGSSEFDFLRGREAYKYLWGARGRLNYRRQFWPAMPA